MSKEGIRMVYGGYMELIILGVVFVIELLVAIGMGDD